jgi:hypothetical protein
LIGVSPLVELMTKNFTVGRTALNVVSNKVAKHEKARSDNQHDFIPFAFDTIGFLEPDTANILKKKVQRVMHNNLISL